MEKISGILPSNARISTVDLSGSSPIRRGQPGFGQESAELAVRGSAKEKTVLENVAPAYERFTQSKLKARREAEIAQRASEGFFINQKQAMADQQEIVADQKNKLTEIKPQSLSTASLAYEFAEAKKEMAKAASLPLANTTSKTSETEEVSEDAEIDDSVQTSIVADFEESMSMAPSIDVDAAPSTDGTRVVGRNLSVVA